MGVGQEALTPITSPLHRALDALGTPNHHGFLNVMENFTPKSHHQHLVKLRVLYVRVTRVQMLRAVTW